MAQLIFRELFASIVYAIHLYDMKSVMAMIDGALGTWAFVPLVDYIACPGMLVKMVSCMAGHVRSWDVIDRAQSEILNLLRYTGEPPTTAASVLVYAAIFHKQLPDLGSQKYQEFIKMRLSTVHHAACIWEGRRLMELVGMPDFPTTLLGTRALSQITRRRSSGRRSARDR